MYDELVKRLRDSEHQIDCCVCDRDCCYPDGKVHGKCIIIEAADAIEELSKPRWIPVTERLPSAEKEVYVTDGEYIARAILLDEVFPGDKPCWSYSGLGEITHWRGRIPLPEPPKEESTSMKHKLKPLNTARCMSRLTTQKREHYEEGE